MPSSNQSVSPLVPWSTTNQHPRILGLVVHPRERGRTCLASQFHQLHTQKGTINSLFRTEDPDRPPGQANTLRRHSSTHCRSTRNQKGPRIRAVANIPAERSWQISNVSTWERYCGANQLHLPNKIRDDSSDAHGSHGCSSFAQGRQDDKPWGTCLIGTI